MKTVAVMQPYFAPYAGYFRLFAAADIVVMFDCVQFPRRGWVHRNRFATSTGAYDWLTLPLEKAPRDELISELRFSSDAEVKFASAVQRFPSLRQALLSRDEVFARVASFSAGSDVTAYLCDLIEYFVQRLDLTKPLVRSSELDVAPELKAQDRVIEICRRMGATHYINPPGGRALYDRAAFSEAGIELGFLDTYGGSSDSLLTRLLQDPAATIAAEIRRESRMIA